MRSLGRTLGNTGTPDAGLVATAVEAWLGAIVSLGRADLGDKTLVDAATPFAQALRERVDAGDGLRAAWAAAVRVADEAARATAALTPRKGRARPLAERSVGTPDPGAISFALCAERVGQVIDAEGER